MHTQSVCVCVNSLDCIAYGVLYLILPRNQKLLKYAYQINLNYKICLISLSLWVSLWLSVTALNLHFTGENKILWTKSYNLNSSKTKGHAPLEFYVMQKDHLIWLSWSYAGHNFFIVSYQVCNGIKCTLHKRASNLRPTVSSTADVSFGCELLTVMSYIFIILHIFLSSWSEIE